jgi:hypothetical protein
MSSTSRYDWVEQSAIAQSSLHNTRFDRPAAQRRWDFRFAHPNGVRALVEGRGRPSGPVIVSGWGNGVMRSCGRNFPHKRATASFKNWRSTQLKVRKRLRSVLVLVVIKRIVSGEPALPRAMGGQHRAMVDGGGF